MKYFVDEVLAKEIAEAVKAGATLSEVVKNFDLMPEYAEALCGRKIVAYAYLFEGVEVGSSDTIVKQETGIDYEQIAAALRDNQTTLELISKAQNITVRKLVDALKKANLNYRIPKNYYDKLLSGEMTIKAACEKLGMTRAQVRDALPEDFNPQNKVVKEIPNEAFQLHLQGKMTARDISREYKISYPTVLKRIQGYRDKNGSVLIENKYQDLLNSVTEFLAAIDCQDETATADMLEKLRSLVK